MIYESESWDWSTPEIAPIRVETEPGGKVMIGTMNEEDWITPKAAHTLANIIIKAADYAEGKRQP